MTVVSEVAELARQAEELRAWKAVRVAARDLGRGPPVQVAGGQAGDPQGDPGSRACPARRGERRGKHVTSETSEIIVETGEIVVGAIPAMSAATNPRNGSGQLVATEEVAERDAVILRLLTSGHSYQQVVDMRLPGIANRGAVSKARRRALDAIRAPAVAEYRAEQLAKLDDLNPARGSRSAIRDRKRASRAG